MNTRQNAISIFEEAVASVQPANLIPRHLSVNNGKLNIFERQFLITADMRIYVVGAGKASAAMAATVEGILGDLITAGIVVTKYEHSVTLSKIVCLEAAHPVPDQSGVIATQQTLQLLKHAKKNDLVICLLSGGASSLWIDIPADAKLPDVSETFDLLLRCGAAIDEVNTVRKHISSVKGGQLLNAAPETTWFSFIISDVPGNDLQVIASGPTVADQRTFTDVKNILQKYGLLDRLPAAILNHIHKGLNGTIKDTPKPGDAIFESVHNEIIGSNAIALKAARDKCTQLGYHLPVVDKELRGDAATIGREIICLCNSYRGPWPACFLLGGETTVSVSGSGKGGRNQHLALSALLEYTKDAHSCDIHPVTFLSAGTDGTDGPTDAAGAIVDRSVIEECDNKKLDMVKYLESFDAYHFFEQTGGLLKTGATQTNVMDLVVVIIE